MIAQFTPEGYVEIDRTRLIEPTTSVGFGARRRFDRAVNWSHPAYANRHIIARNDHEIIRGSRAESPTCCERDTSKWPREIGAVRTAFRRSVLRSAQQQTHFFQRCGCRHGYGPSC